MACQCRRHLPRQQDVFADGSDEGALANSKKICLTRTDMAIRSREVYYTFVPNPELNPDLKSMPELKREGLKLNVYLLEEAANMCGLNGQRLFRWYSVSKWANEKNSTLSLKQFQCIVERYAQADRDAENIRSLVEDNLKKDGRRLKYDFNDSNNYELINPRYKKRCASKKRKPYLCPCVGEVAPKVNKVMNQAKAILKKTSHHYQARD